MRILHVTPHLPPDQAANALLPWQLGLWGVEAGDNVATLQVAGHAVGHMQVEEEHPSEEYLAQERNGYHSDPASFHIPNPSFFPIIAAFGLVMMAVGMIFGYAITATSPGWS